MENIYFTEQPSGLGGYILFSGWYDVKKIALKEKPQIIIAGYTAYPRIIDWKKFRKIIGSKWVPGLSMPFDPRASRDAEILKIKVIVINGKYLERLESFLNKKEFIGTLIQ